MTNPVIGVTARSNAPDYEQHLITDINDALSRLAENIPPIDQPAFTGDITVTNTAPIITLKTTADDSFSDIVFQREEDSQLMWSIGNSGIATPSPNDFYILQLTNSAGASVNSYRLIISETGVWTIDGSIEDLVLTGTPTAPSASGSTDTAQVATTAFTQDAIDARLTYATQSDQESASSTTLIVTPGQQQFHPSAGKCWGYVTVSGGTPTLQLGYNTTSITDTGTGQLTVTIATDFSSGLNYSLVVTGGTNLFFFVIGVKAIGSFRIDCFDTSAVAADPAHYSYATFGDQ